MRDEEVRRERDGLEDRIDTVSQIKTCCQNNGKESTSVKYVSRKCKIWHEMTAAAVCGIPQIHAESCGSWILDYRYSAFLEKKCVARTVLIFSCDGHENHS